MEPTVGRQISSGFSIIELMIVILILGMALTKAIPFTVDWVNGAHVTETESALVDAIGLAKAKALRNAKGIISGEAVTAVCYSESLVQVVEAADAATSARCTGGSTQVWKMALNGNVGVTVGNAAFSCLCVDAKAQLVSSASCNSCSTSTVFLLEAGGVSDTVEIY